MANDYNSGEYNKGGMIAFVFSMVFTIGFFIYIAFIHPGVDLKEIAEQKAEAAKEAAPAPSEAPAAAPAEADATKPWVSSVAAIEHGKQVYMTSTCNVCHGDKGDGNGPGGMSLVPKPRDFIKGDWKAGGKASDIFTTVTKGMPGTSMAAFGHIPLNDRWAVVHYIQSITKNKVDQSAEELEAFAKTAQ